MRTEMQIGVALTLALLLLPGCKGTNSDDSAAQSHTTNKNSGAVGNVSKDQDMAKAVQAKIDADPGLKAAGVQAKVKGAQVELTGTVKRIDDKDKAETIAKDAVKPYSSINAGVLNNITIAEPGESSGNGTDSKTPAEGTSKK